MSNAIFPIALGILGLLSALLVYIQVVNIFIGMKLLRCILYPLALLYGFIVAIRNFLFDRGFLKTHTISMPSIGVGHLMFRCSRIYWNVCCN